MSEYVEIHISEDVDHNLGNLSDAGVANEEHVRLLASSASVCRALLEGVCRVLPQTAREMGELSLTAI